IFSRTTYTLPNLPRPNLFPISKSDNFQLRFLLPLLFILLLLLLLNKFTVSISYLFSILISFLLIVGVFLLLIFMLFFGWLLKFLLLAVFETKLVLLVFVAICAQNTQQH